MKSDRFQNPYLHYGILSVIYGLGLATLLIHGLFHHAEAQSNQPIQPCSGTHSTYTLTINDKELTPATTNTKRCDKLIINNSTGGTHIMAFGPHAEHVDYPGLDDALIQPHSSIQIVLSVTGSYPIHDHLSPNLTAEINIAN